MEFNTFLLDALNELVIIIDANLSIKYLNRAAVSNLNLGVAHNYCGKDFKEFCTEFSIKYPKLKISDPNTKYKFQQKIHDLVIEWRYFYDDKNSQFIFLGENISEIIRIKKEDAQKAKEETERVANSDKQFIAEYIGRITGQKQDAPRPIEENIQIMKNYFENIIAKMPGLVYWKNAEGIYLGCNDAIAKTYGLKSREEIIGITDYEMYTPAEVAILRKNDLEVMTSQKEIVIEESPIMPDTGNRRYYMSSKVPLFDENKEKVIGILGSSIDITELKKVEQQLREAKELAERMTQAKSNFLATMSHELRTPLNGILGMAQVLIGQELSPEQKEYVEAIELSGRNLLELINDVLDFSRLEAGQIELHPEVTSLARLIDDIALIMQYVIQNKAIELKIEIDPELPEYVLADTVRLRQILINLIGNAIKFTLQGHVLITVRLLSKKDNMADIEINIEDTGIGIPTDKLNAVFERFTQVESQYGRRFEGSGLGLAIVKNLIEMMDGSIQVQSELGVGSKFSFTIPFRIAEQNQSKANTNLPTHLSFSDKTLQFDTYILVVEDNPINQTVMRAMLAKLGCRVDVASNGQQAITQFKKHEYDLIFMDIGLPDLDGLQVTKSLLELEKKLHRKHIPIIALTAHVMEEDRKNCMNAGMTEVLTKPIVHAQLVDLLKKLVKPSKQSR